MEIVCLLLYAYYVILFARIILSWVTMFWSPPPALDPVIRVVYELTEPVMSFFRRFIPPIGGFDLSPIFIFLILRVVQSQLCSGI